MHLLAPWWTILYIVPGAHLSMSLFGAALVLITGSSMSWIDAEACFGLLLPNLIFGLGAVVECEELFTFSDKPGVEFLDFCFVNNQTLVQITSSFLISCHLLHELGYNELQVEEEIGH